MNSRSDRVERMFDDDGAPDPLDDAPRPSTIDATAGDAPIFAFEGYTVDFNTKVALMPVQPAATQVATWRGAARGPAA